MPTDNVGAGWFIVAMVVCTLLALGVRTYKVDGGSFFNDELYTVQTAADFGGTNLSKRLGYVPARIALMIEGVDLGSLDLERPETWADAGITERSLRLPHAILGVLTVPALMLASRRVIGARGAVAFGVLLAASQWHVYWSQTARFYIVQFVFVNLALLLWCSSARARRPVVYTLAMVCAFLGFWSQPQALLVFGVMGLDWLVAMARRDPIRLALWQWVVGAVAVLACVALLGIDLTQRAEQWEHMAGKDTWLTPQELVLGVAYWIWPPAAAFAGLAGLWMLAKYPRAGVPLAIGAGLPVIVFAAMAPFSFIGTRYAFMCLGPALAIAAVGLVRIYDELRPKTGMLLAAAPAAAVILGQLFATAVYFRSGGNFHTPMREVAWHIAARNDAGDTVYAHEDEVIRYYARTDNVAFLPRTPDEVASITEPAWFVFQVSHGGEPDPRSQVPGMFFERRFGLVQIHSKAALDVYRYEPHAD
ncbi:MAG: hypothetical protein DHS20C14_12200 [Phycisphaeraceae bacterium]|nr:MAG: hypothetical protein DHS20C14_12200 [Phycisphaeraceae bacterium]